MIHDQIHAQHGSTRGLTVEDLNADDWQLLIHILIHTGNYRPGIPSVDPLD